MEPDKKGSSFDQNLEPHSKEIVDRAFDQVDANLPQNFNNN